MVTLFAQVLNGKSTRMPMSDYVNLAKESGHSAIFYAIGNEDESITKALLKRGANPNAELKSTGWTPMHFAAKLGTVEQLKLFLDYGGDPLKSTNDGQSILDCAEGRPFSFRSKVMHFLNEALDAIYDEEDAAVERGDGGSEEL